MRITTIVTITFLLWLTCAHFSHKHSQGANKKNPFSRSTKAGKWSKDDLFLYGMLSGTAVSLIGFVAAFLLLGLRKIISEKIFGSLIQVLFAFSCGALLGEALIHILPQAYQSKELGNSQVSLTFIGAIFCFIFIDRLMTRAGIAHQHWMVQQQDPAHAGHEHRPPQLQATGFLNLISSLLHNFIDGLAIGVAYSLGNPKQFIPVAVGIIAHQIPRQMGDVAVLLKSGFNSKQTILSNGFVNMISLVGVYLGLNSHNLSPTLREYSLVFVAGNFVYIASDIWRNLLRNNHIKTNLLEIVGLGVGIWLSLQN